MRLYESKRPPMKRDSFAMRQGCTVSYPSYPIIKKSLGMWIIGKIKEWLKSRKPAPKVLATFRSFSGVDFLVYWGIKREMEDPDWKVIPWVQGMSYTRDHMGVSGTMIGVVGNGARSTFETTFPDQLKEGEKIWIKLRGATEYGKIMEFWFKDFKPITVGAGISVDDIVLEQQLTYEARDMHVFDVIPAEKNKPEENK